MRLAELNPKWSITNEYWHYDDALKTNPKRHGQGITFVCPVCKNHRVAVWFKNPIDGIEQAPGLSPLWNRNGDTFENLTINPSVDLRIASCWHGFVRSGEVT
jgi:hypothetical protein